MGAGGLEVQELSCVKYHDKEKQSQSSKTNPNPYCSHLTTGLRSGSKVAEARQLQSAGMRPKTAWLPTVWLQRYMPDSKSHESTLFSDANQITSTYTKHSAPAKFW